MQFTLTIKCDNAAFYDDEVHHDDDPTPIPGPEVARLLSETARKVEGGNTHGTLFDYNGNRVGTFEFTEAN